ncbi:MAG: TIR domain-containing protein [Lentisphaeria bacterium]|nr:TIR domain-containing protein [Lentisphaeria bacterium]
MSYKIFVSYKYGDTNVLSLKNNYPYPNNGTWSFAATYEPTKVRDYVTKLQELLEKNHHINKGEADNESLANFKDSTIASKLRNKIFDSSVTIVMISPGMKEYGKLERDQWIPWEISYSLCEYGRNGRTSHTNAMLAVVLPDRNGSYSYCLDERPEATVIYTDNLFEILRKNMFNQKIPSIRQKNGIYIYSGESCYIPCVKWSDFKLNPNLYIERVIKIRDNIDSYNIYKTV